MDGGSLVLEGDGSTVDEISVFNRVMVRGELAEGVGRDLGLDPEEVAAICVRVQRQAAIQERGRDPFALKTVQMARLENQWREAMAGWYRSTEEETSTKARSGSGSKWAERSTRSRVGDVRFLEQARRVLEEMRDLAVRDFGEVEFVNGMSQEERDTEVERMLVEFMRRAAESVIVVDQVSEVHQAAGDVDQVNDVDVAAGDVDQVSDVQQAAGDVDQVNDVDVAAGDGDQVEGK